MPSSAVKSLDIFGVYMTGGRALFAIAVSSTDLKKASKSIHG